MWCGQKAFYLLLHKPKALQQRERQKLKQMWIRCWYRVLIRKYLNFLGEKSFGQKYLRSFSLSCQIFFNNNLFFLNLGKNKKYMKALHGCFYPYFLHLLVNCAVSGASFIWVPAGSLNLNLMFVSLCSVALCQGYVNWLSAGGFVPFSAVGGWRGGWVYTFSFMFGCFFSFHISQVLLACQK